MTSLQRFFLSFLLFTITFFATGCHRKHNQPPISKENILYISFETRYATLHTGESQALRLFAYDQNNTAYDITDYAQIEESNSSVVELLDTTCRAKQKGQSMVVATYAALRAAIAVTVVSQEIQPAITTPNPFTDQYGTAIPEDATVSGYDGRRFSVITGVVQGIEGDLLSGVRITLKNHPEYGSTLTDESGFFEIATEASGFQVIDYQKPGYTPLQRKIKTQWNQILRIDDVMMLKIDDKSTFIDLNFDKVQIHESSSIDDLRGKRSASIVFNNISKAKVINSDGSSYTLSKFNVRATEFITPQSMPASLPVTSAFTYCIDVTLDGVDSEAMVYFDKNISFFVDNFLDFPVGTFTPVGYYSRSQSQWIAMSNGIVVKLLDENGDGKVDGLDADGDDKADDLNDNNQTSDEILGLEESDRYKANQTYTLFYSDHFTSIDPNHGPGPNDSNPDPSPKPDDDPDCQADPFNSYVNPGDRSFHEDIMIPGTNIKLWYSSKDTQGYHIKFHLDTSRKNLGSIASLFSVEIAGKRYGNIYKYRQSTDIATYYWNRKDYKGEIVSVPQNAIFTINQINEEYTTAICNSSCPPPPVWRASASNLFGLDLEDIEGVNTFGSVFISGAVSGKIASTQKKYSGINQNNIANGWEFNDIHDTVNSLDIINDTDTTVNFTSLRNMPDYIDSRGKSYVIDWLHYPCASPNRDRYRNRKLFVDDQGTLYRVCGQNGHQYIKRFGADGQNVEHYIGGGNQTYTEDINRTQITFGSDIDFTIDDDSNIIVTDTDNHRIYKQYATGQFRLLVGNEEGDSDGKLYEAALSRPTEPVADHKGNLYFIDQGNKKVKKITTSGEVMTVIGQIEGDTHSGDGGLATEATIPVPTNLAIDSNNNLYLGFGNNGSPYNRYNERIRKITPQGYIYPVAGEKSSVSPWYGRRSVDGRYAILNYYYQTMNMFVDPLGRIRVGPYIITIERASSLIFDEERQQYRYYNGNILKIFDSKYNHLSTIDTDTNTTLYRFGYTDKNKLQTITDRYNRVTTIEYDGTTPTAIVAPNGDRLELEVDAQRNLVSVTYPDSGVQHFEYDQNNLMTRMTEPNGNSFTHTYDEYGRLQHFEDEEGGAWEYGITIDDTQNSRTITKTSATGNTRTKTYVTPPNRTKTTTQTDPDGTLTSTSNDGFTAISRQCGIERKRTRYTSGGSIGSKTLRSTLDVDGSYRFHDCHISSTEKQFVDNNSSQLSSTLSTVMQSGSRSACYAIDDNNYYKYYFNVSTIYTDYQNHTTTLSTPQGRTLKTTFDPVTQLTTRIEQPGLLPINYSYDPHGKLLTTTQGDRLTQNLYDDKEDLITTVDPKGVPTHYAYDAMHRVIEISRAGQTVRYSYDANGNLSSTTTPNLATFAEQSNQINYLKQRTSPLGLTTHYTYTPDRELESITLPSGKKIAYTYSQTHLTQQSTPEATTTYSYGCGGLLTDIHVDSGEAIGYTYNPMHQLTTLSYSGLLNQTLGYGDYHPLYGLPQSITYAGQTQDLGYDKDGLLIQAGATTLHRDPDSGSLSSLEVGDYTQSYSYNSYGERDRRADIYNQNNLYTYDILSRSLSGQIETRVEQITDHRPAVYTYSYDSAGRLTEVQTDGQITEYYRYDHNGNRLQATVQGVTTTASYTLDDQLVVYGDSTYRYNDDGYLMEKITPDGTTTYEYGTMGELLSVTTPEHTITYGHNALNQRVAKLIDGEVVEKYLWRDLTTLLAVYDAEDILVQRFAYAGGRMPVAMTDTNGTTYYLHYDQVGSLRAISDTNHAIVKAITYDTYGNILTDSNPSFKVPFGFAGGLYDADTQLTRFGYRDYDAYTGKWTAKDPIGFDGGDSNLYGYVLGDPVNFIDPEGLAGTGPSIFDIIFPDTLNSGENEELSKMYQQYKRWRYENGKIFPIDPKTKKPLKPNWKCQIGFPDPWEPPLSPTQKPPSGGTPKTWPQKIIKGFESLLRLFGHWK